MKNLSDTDAELKKSIAYKKACISRTKKVFQVKKVLPVSKQFQKCSLLETK